MVYRRMNQTLFGKLASSAIAATLVLSLSSCGGGSSTTTPVVSSTLLAAPATFIAFGNAPNTVAITGGKGPFKVVSNNPTVVPVTGAITGASFIFTPTNVTVNTPVTLTVTDSAAATSVVTVTVTPATIPSGSIKLTNAAGSICAPVNNAANSAATLCAGEAGTASVTLKDAAGAPLANRSVHFEALTIGATFAATANAAIFSRVASVNTDAQGVATVAMRADVESSSEAAFLRATDTVSTHRVDTWITVLKQTSGASALNVVPTTGGVVGYFSNECPFVRREFNVYGGTAPYAITLPAANTLVLANESAAATPGSGVTVARSGGRFTAENAAAACTTSSTLMTITDATGATTTATYTTAPGSTARSTTPSTDLTVLPATLSLTADPLSTYCSSSTARYAVSGGTGPYIVSTSIPQIVATPSAAGGIDVSFVSDSKWRLLKGQTTSILALDAAGKVAVASISCI